MTFFGSVNVTDSGTYQGKTGIRVLQEALVAAGWTAITSGSGTGGTYSTSADVSNGYWTARAWVRMQSPLIGSVRKEFTFQSIDVNSTSWRIKYSANNGFIGGSPTSNTTPSATDETVIRGSGTDASPGGEIIFQSQNSYRYHVVAGDSSEMCSFWLAAIPAGGGQPTSALVYEPMLSGTYPIEDIDPYIIYTSFASNTGVASTILSIANGPASLVYPNPTGQYAQGATYAWLGKGLGGQGFRQMPMCINADQSPGNPWPTVEPALGLNPFSGKDDLLPTFFCRRVASSATDAASAPFGYKGMGRTMFLLGSVTRTTGDTLTITNPRDYIVMGSVALPWTGVTPVI